MARRATASRLPASGVTMLVLAVVVGLGALTFVRDTVLPAIDGLRFGFPSYYTSSRLIIDGAWTADVYDDDWFHARSLEASHGRPAPAGAEPRPA